MTTAHDYDAVPYDDCPLVQTAPNNLFVIAKLFGVDAQTPDKCRVLELGCASGGNLIPMAYYSPESHFTGVELSGKQARLASELIDKLSLSNLKIIQADVTTLDESLGQFDYIIAHGLYSWVPAPVQNHILKLIKSTLAPNGVAFVSYNTYPGWRFRQVVRDMMLHHAGETDSPELRRDKGIEMLTMLEKGMSDNSSLSEKWLKQETKMLLARSPSYLLHDYLERDNHPCYFYEFMQRASALQLQYLAEADVYTMLGSTLTEQASSELDKIDDLVEYEQYLDFYYLRYFRQTLLCHAGMDVNRELDLECITQFYFSLVLTSGEEIDLHSNTVHRFKHPNGTHFEISHPLTKAAVVELTYRYPDNLSFYELEQRARAILNENNSEFASANSGVMITELFNLFVSQGVILSTTQQRYYSQVSEKPVANPLAQVYAKHDRCCVGTVHHDSIALDELDRYLLTLLDGTRTLHDIEAQISQRLKQDSEFLQASGWKGSESTEIQRQVTNKVNQSLYFFAMHGLLSS